MPNWTGWVGKLDVVYADEDNTLPSEERTVVKDIFLPLGVALAKTAPRSQLFHDLARCYTEKHCTALVFNPKTDQFDYERDGKEKHVRADLFQEKGFRVCQRPSGDVYIRWGKTVSGTLAVDMTDAVCDEGDTSLGTIHLHPAGAVFPSGNDMLVSIRDKYNCISGKVYDPSVRKDFARVFCSVTDDAYLWPEDVKWDPVRAAAEYSDVVKMTSKYNLDVHRAIVDYGVYELVVKDEKGNVFDYIFPPTSLGALGDLLRKVKQDFRDSHSFELFVVDLSDSEPPSLSTLEK